MTKSVDLREDYGCEALRLLAKTSRDPRQVRRLLALAAIYGGASRTEAAKTGGTSLQVLRDWILRFNAFGPDGLIDRKAPGRLPLLNDEQRYALAGAIESGVNPYFGFGDRWRLSDLVQLLKDRFGISVSETTVGRELRAMGYPRLRDHGYTPHRKLPSHRDRLSSHRPR